MAKTIGEYLDEVFANVPKENLEEWLNKEEEEFNKKLNSFPKKLNAEQAFDYLCLADSDSRWEWFKDLVEQKRLTSNKAFKTAFAFAYTSGNVNDWKFFFNRCYYNWALLTSPCFDRDGGKEFKKLPETITLYRGTGMDELESEAGWYGPSWTTDRGVAEFFAFRHYGRDRVVVKTEVKKSDIRGFFSDRNEHEALYVADELPEIVTKVPTEEFRRYFSEIHPDEEDNIKNLMKHYNASA